MSKIVGLLAIAWVVGIGIGSLYVAVSGGWYECRPVNSGAPAQLNIEVTQQAIWELVPNTQLPNGFWVRRPRLGFSD